MELCRLASILPSDYWRLREDYNATTEECYQFDRAHLDFDRWFDGKANEQTIVPAPRRQPKKGQMWGPKYSKDHDIFALYYRSQGEIPPLDPVVEQMTDDDLMALVMGEPLETF